MTQLTVTVEDVSMLDQIRQAISMLRGVASVTLKRQTKTGMDRAIDDIKNGRVYEADSVEDLIRLAPCMGPKRQGFGVVDDEYRHSFRPVRKE